MQPVDPLDLWESPPFEATVRDGEIYARGAADDKGQVFMHFKAVEAHLKQSGRLPVNIKFILEGEEEVGSVHLDDFIRAHKEELRADSWSFPTRAMFDRGVPSICYGLRGLVYCPDRIARQQERHALGRRSAAPSRTRRSCWRR